MILASHSWSQSLCLLYQLKCTKLKLNLLKLSPESPFILQIFLRFDENIRVWYVCYFERPVLKLHDQTPSLSNRKPIGCSALIVPPPLFCRAWQPLNTTSCGCAAQEHRPKLWGRSLHAMLRSLLDEPVTRMSTWVKHSLPQSQHRWWACLIPSGFVFFSVIGWRMHSLSHLSSFEEFFRELGLYLIWTQSRCDLSRLLCSFKSKDACSRVATLKHACIWGRALSRAHGPNYPFWLCSAFDWTSHKQLMVKSYLFIL